MDLSVFRHLRRVVVRREHRTSPAYRQALYPVVPMHHEIGFRSLPGPSHRARSAPFRPRRRRVFRARFRVVLWSCVTCPWRRVARPFLAAGLRQPFRVVVRRAPS